MTTWPEFYRKRIGDTYSQHVRNKYATFIEFVESHGKVFFEAGCGIGSISRILYENDTNRIVVGADLDCDMVHMAIHNCPEPVELFLGDIKDVNTYITTHTMYDTIHSHGVLEHFSDREIIEIIGLQRNHARFLCHYVPSDKYTTPSFGDERLLSNHYWRLMLAQFRPKVIEFNQGHDLIICIEGLV